MRFCCFSAWPSALFALLPSSSRRGDSMSHSFDEQAAALTRNVSAALAEAFEAGRIAGIAEASEDFRARLAQVFGGATGGPQSVITMQPTSGSTNANHNSQTRIIIQTGSVKQAILDAINEEPGIEPERIQAKTAAKANTLRGTLFALKNEGAIHKQGRGWFPGPDNSSEPVTALTENSADGLFG